MKKVCAAILLFGVILSVVACGEPEHTGDSETTDLAKQPEIKKEVYWEKTEDLGLEEKSTVRLESGAEHQGLEIVIDEEAVSLEGEEGIRYENPNFTKMIKKDFDKDGVMEIILLFFGGSGGIYQNFRMIRSNGENWEMVPMDFNDEEMESFVKVKASQNNSVQIDVEKTGYRKTVPLPDKYQKKEKEDKVFGIGYRFFEVQGEDIIVACRLYADKVGEGIGDVRQKIGLDETGTKLILGETSYMPIEKAQKRAYEVY